MALEQFQQGAEPAGRDMIQALVELQQLNVNVLTGANAATPIAVAGITTQDTVLVGLLYRDPGATTTASVVKLTPSIPSNGNVQFVEATNTNAGDRVVLWWYKKPAL